MSAWCQLLVQFLFFLIRQLGVSEPWPLPGVSGAGVGGAHGSLAPGSGKLALPAQA